MNSNHHIHHHTVRAALHLSEQLKPFSEVKDPKTAALCGFFAGGIGLGLYFKSFGDFVMPVVLWIVCTLFAPVTIGTSYIAAGCFCAAYGYRRAKASNAKLAQQWSDSNVPPVVSVYPPAYASQPQTGRIIDVTAVPRLVSVPPPIPSSPPPIQAAASQSSSNKDHGESLRKLERLFLEKLITDEEYRAKRQHILSDI